MYFSRLKGLRVEGTTTSPTAGAVPGGTAAAADDDWRGIAAVTSIANESFAYGRLAEQRVVDSNA